MGPQMLRPGNPAGTPLASRVGDETGGEGLGSGQVRNCFADDSLTHQAGKGVVADAQDLLGLAGGAAELGVVGGPSR